jgi:hypothetical protein
MRCDETYGLNVAEFTDSSYYTAGYSGVAGEADLCPPRHSQTVTTFD